MLMTHHNSFGNTLFFMPHYHIYGTTPIWNCWRPQPHSRVSITGNQTFHIFVNLEPPSGFCYKGKMKTERCYQNQKEIFTLVSMMVQMPWNIIMQKLAKSSPHIISAIWILHNWLYHQNQFRSHPICNMKGSLEKACCYMVWKILINRMINWMDHL